MPKRSNTFQRLATLIHERLGQEWKVTESHMFKDFITGEAREVDIVAQSTVASYPLYLSIECRDHARPADILWVEGAAKKHEHLPTSKLVLWSRSGFTKAALVKAEALKITAVSQLEATQTDWAILARSLPGGHVQYVTPSFKAFIDVIPAKGEIRRLDDVANASWYRSDGALAGTVQGLIQFMGKSSETRTVVLDNTKAGKASYYAELNPPEPWFTDLPEGGRVEIQRIGVGIDTFTEKVPLTTASALAEGKVTTLAMAIVATGTLEFLVDESSDGNTSTQSRLFPKKT